MEVVEQEAWQSYLSFYVALKEKMEKDGWIAEGWQFEVSEQPDFSSVTGQLSRPNWYNEGRGGIHFDSSIGPKQLEEQAVAIMLHCHKDFPKPAEFCQLVAERSVELAGAWEGCAISCTSKFQPLVITLPFTRENLAGQLEKGFYRVKQLGPVIDQTIEDVLK